MSSIARACRTSALIRRAVPAQLHVRALVGAVAVAASVGCGEITEAVEGDIGDLDGSYVLTHHNANAVPVRIRESSEWTEILESGTLEVDLESDSTFTLTFVETVNSNETGESYTSPSVLSGPLSITGNTVRLTVVQEDGEAENVPWALAGDFRAGVLRVDFAGESNIGVVSFRKRED